MQEHLRHCGISTAVYYPLPLHLQECFTDLGYQRGQFPHAELACDEVLALPLFPELSEQQQQQVIAAVAEFMLGTELSCVAPQDGRSRRVHMLVLAPTMATVERINTALV